jgi:hypothetical protein
MLFIKQPLIAMVVGSDFENARKAFDKTYPPNADFSRWKTREGTLALLEGKLSTGKITLFLYVRINHAKDQLNVTEAMKHN